MKIGAAKAIFYLDVNDIFSLFSTFFASYWGHSLQAKSTNTYWAIVSFFKIGAV